MPQDVANVSREHVEAFGRATANKGKAASAHWFLVVERAGKMVHKRLDRDGGHAVHPGYEGVLPSLGMWLALEWVS